MAGYTRNDVSNNIANGNVIDADDLDGEFNAIQAAFHESTGHTHDGTSANGAPITVVGPNQEFVASASSYYPKTNNTYDLGSATFQWKDIYISGSIQGDLNGDITGNATTASALETARTISLTGGATGSTTFDGSANAAIAVTVVGSASQAFSASTLTATTVNATTTSATTVNATTVDLGNWTVTESAGVLYFATGGVNKMKLDASGNLTVVGDITAFGTV